MQRKISSMFFTIILFSLMFSFASIPVCSANDTNWGILTEGDSFNNGTHISMPFVNAEVNITRTEAAVYTTLSSESHILTKITQNATLAFIYPSPNQDKLLYNSSGSEPNPDMRIFANGTKCNYTVVGYDYFVDHEFAAGSDENYSFIQPWTRFAVFDVKLTANTTMIVSTVSSINYIANMDEFDYNYIISSARSFEGSAFERVHFHIVEQVPFSSTNFDPNGSLTITHNGIDTDAVWEFHMPAFPVDTLSFDGYFESTNAIILRYLVITLITFVIVVAFYKFIEK